MSISSFQSFLMSEFSERHRKENSIGISIGVDLCGMEPGYSLRWKRIAIAYGVVPSRV